jgi:hypothetical protein
MYFWEVLISKLLKNHLFLLFLNIRLYLFILNVLITALLLEFKRPICFFENLIHESNFKKECSQCSFNPSIPTLKRTFFVTYFFIEFSPHLCCANLDTQIPLILFLENQGPGKSILIINFP